MEDFVYNPEITIGRNFQLWYNMDSVERDVWGEYRLSELEAIKVFSERFDIPAVEVQDSLATDRKKRFL